jgi:hypothetical protein
MSNSASEVWCRILLGIEILDWYNLQSQWGVTQTPSTGFLPSCSRPQLSTLRICSHCYCWVSWRDKWQAIWTLHSFRDPVGHLPCLVKTMLGPHDSSTLSSAQFCIFPLSFTFVDPIKHLDSQILFQCLFLESLNLWKLIRSLYIYIVSIQLLMNKYCFWEHS